MSATPSMMTWKLLRLAVLLRRFMISTSVVSGFIISSMLVTTHLRPQPGTAWKSDTLPTVSVHRTCNVTASWLLLKVCTFYIALIVVPIIDGVASVGDAINDNSVIVTVKGMFVLYSAVSSPLDRPKCFTLHPLADLFIPTPTRLLREPF